MQFAELDAVTVDAYGTLVRLADPVSQLVAALGRHGIVRDREAVAAAFAADAQPGRQMRYWSWWANPSIAAEIGLTPAQRAAVDSIMDERHRIIDSIMGPVRPQITAARESARRQIRAHLTPEQERRFDAYLKRQETAKQ